MIISFNGPAGSGKSTVAKMLAEKLGWPYYYIGGLRRMHAKERGITLAEYNKIGETDSRTDMEVDDYQKELGKTEDNFVIEGRTSWFFIPQSIKIYIDVNNKVGARRIFQQLQNNNTRNEDKDLRSVDDVLKSNLERYASDTLRYQKYYSFDVYDKKHYDFIIDSSNLNIDEAFEKVSDYVEKCLKKSKLCS